MRSSLLTTRWMASAAVAASLVAVAVLPGQAEAAGRSTMIQNIGINAGTNNHYCMDGNASGKLYMSPCQNGNDFQWFEVTDYRLNKSSKIPIKQIKHKKSGLCLEGTGIAVVNLNPCRPGLEQEWSSTGDDRWFLGAKKGCLAADKTKVSLAACDLKRPDQQWLGIH